VGSKERDEVAKKCSIVGKIIDSRRFTTREPVTGEFRKNHPVPPVDTSGDICRHVMQKPQISVEYKNRSPGMGRSDDMERDVYVPRWKHPGIYRYFFR
jgi:hypothetical protein